MESGRLLIDLLMSISGDKNLEGGCQLSVDWGIIQVFEMGSLI